MVNNKVILMGRLTRDAKIMDSKGEDAGKMATFSLAVDKMRKKQEPGNDADAENNVVKLYKMKCERKLFTYPPVYLEVDEMAYLRTERSSYYGEE